LMGGSTSQNTGPNKRAKRVENDNTFLRRKLLRFVMSCHQHL